MLASASPDQDREPEAVPCDAGNDPGAGVECIFERIGAQINAGVEHSVGVVVGAAGGAAIGGLLGHFIGQHIVREGWVPVPGVRFSAALSPAGGVGVSLELRHRAP